MLGFVTHELAFPHVTHNFRNITLDILTVHVKKKIISLMKYQLQFVLYLISSTESALANIKEGHPRKYY